MSSYEKKWNTIDNFSKKQKVMREWEKAIVENVFGGEEALRRLINEHLNSFEIKNSDRELSEQEIAKLVLKNIDIQGYEMSDCLKIVRDNVWKIRKENKKINMQEESSNKDSAQTLAEKARKDWNKEAKRSGFEDGEDLESFLKEN